MNGKGVFQLRDMIGSPNCAAGLPDGRYVRAVPEPFWFGLLGRFSGAWEVIRGRAFPVEWPKAGDLEAALQHDPRPRPRPTDPPRFKASDANWAA